jgi:hypothetical protein
MKRSGKRCVCAGDRLDYNGLVSAFARRDGPRDLGAEAADYADLQFFAGRTDVKTICFDVNRVVETPAGRVGDCDREDTASARID